MTMNSSWNMTAANNLIAQLERYASELADLANRDNVDVRQVWADICLASATATHVWNTLVAHETRVGRRNLPYDDIAALTNAEECMDSIRGAVDVVGFHWKLAQEAGQ